MPAGLEPKVKKALKQDPTQQVVEKFKQTQRPVNQSDHQSGHRSGHRS